MSLILDALNRAENERKNQKAVPDIGTLHTPIEITEATDSGKKLWIIAALMMLVGLIVAVWFFAKDDRATLALPITAVESEEENPSVLTSVSTPEMQQFSRAANEESANKQVSSGANTQGVVVELPNNIAESPNAILSASVAPDNVGQLYSAPEAASEIDADINDLYAAESSEGSTPIVELFADTETTAVVTADPEVPARTFASITNIPDFNDLPWNTRQSIPTISYARHNFLANGLSSVVINNQTCGVGNIISIGQFVVQEIYVDGVVLKHGNTQFKLRALNGWINM